MTMVVRQSPRNAFEFFERGWRIALAWICILFVVVPLCLAASVIMVAFAWGFVNSVITGEPMPDLTAGFDRVLPSIMPYVGPAISAGLAGLGALLASRNREVTAAIRAGGGQGQPPFAQSLPQPSASEASPTGGLVNDNALGGSSP